MTNLYHLAAKVSKALGPDEDYTVEKSGGLMWLSYYFPGGAVRTPFFEPANIESWLNSELIRSES